MYQTIRNYLSLGYIRLQSSKDMSEASNYRAVSCDTSENRAACGTVRPWGFNGTQQTTRLVLPGCEAVSCVSISYASASWNTLDVHIRLRSCPLGITEHSVVSWKTDHKTVSWDTSEHRAISWDTSDHKTVRWVTQDHKVVSWKT